MFLGLIGPSHEALLSLIAEPRQAVPIISPGQLRAARIAFRLLHLMLTGEFVHPGERYSDLQGDLGPWGPLGM